MLVVSPLLQMEVHERERERERENGVLSLGCFWEGWLCLIALFGVLGMLRLKRESL